MSGEIFFNMFFFAIFKYHFTFLKKVAYIVLLVWASSFTFAQGGGDDYNRTIDSLKTALNATEDDTIKVNILLQLVELISDDHVWPQYNEQMLKISGKIVQSKNVSIRRKGKKGMLEQVGDVGVLSLSCNGKLI